MSVCSSQADVAIKYLCILEGLGGPSAFDDCPRRTRDSGMGGDQAILVWPLPLSDRWGRSGAV